MKKIILLALTALMMVGCGNGKTVDEDTEICKEHYHTIILDSCEYISNDNLWDMTHKGNCRFCKERDSIKWEKRKKELEGMYNIKEK